MTTPSTTDAAIYMLSTRAQDHHRKATQAMIATVYVNSTPIPETAENAVKITEQALMDSLAAEGIHHNREAQRFEDAIEAIKAAAA